MKKINKIIAFMLSATYIPLSIGLDVSQTPLILSEKAAPLMMLIMGRDHKMFYEAYNDASDLNGDGVLDIVFKPDEITYVGLFEPRFCYNYNNADGYFEPVAYTNNFKCRNVRAGRWSGAYLNYLTTSKMDLVKKVLYGGTRVTDDLHETILERSYIPRDAHSWGKEYSRDYAFNISDYTPFNAPRDGTRHLFATTSNNENNKTPLLRVAKDKNFRIWNWVSKERNAADNVYCELRGTKCEENDIGVILDYHVKVKVCVDQNWRNNLDQQALSEKCKRYNYTVNGDDRVSLKPIGLLQEYGDNDKIKYGLLTGSYSKNTSGGVLRKAVSSFTDEVDVSGRFNYDLNSIVRTIDALSIKSYNGSTYQPCDANSKTNTVKQGNNLRARKLNDGQCQDWGNPLAEMLYESLRYFSGKNAATPEFFVRDEQVNGKNLSAVGNWNNPYSDENYCAIPNQLVISDNSPSFDSDQLPGAYNFPGAINFAGDLDFNGNNLNLSNESDFIWNNSVGDAKNIFIGQVQRNYDAAPTSKRATTFYDIRGLAPDDPTRQGSYYSSAITRFASNNDINPIQGRQSIDTYVVAFPSPIPRIRINSGNNLAEIIPFAKTIGNYEEGYYATNQIVDFYVTNIDENNNSGEFSINFEDVEQGNDHDMDAIVNYKYELNGDILKVTLDSTYAYAGAEQHLGYVISGVEHSGVYLEVRDLDNKGSKVCASKLDTPPGMLPGYCNDRREGPDKLPLRAEREFRFSLDQETIVEQLKNPLWYAAKFGLGDQKALTPGEPSNYYLASRPQELSTGLRNIFELVASNTGSSSSAAAADSFFDLNNGGVFYQGKYRSVDWSGQILAKRKQAAGNQAEELIWSTDNTMPANNRAVLDPAQRVVITYNRDNQAGLRGVPFRSDNAALPDSFVRSLGITDNNNNNVDADTFRVAYINYIRGDQTEAERYGFRQRTYLLGDIINSDPVFVQKPIFNYPRKWKDKRYPGTNMAENSKSHYEFKRQQRNRQSMIYVGANDGMLHAINASTEAGGNGGKEELAYIPSMLLSKLRTFTYKDYADEEGNTDLRRRSHQFYVDGHLTYADIFDSNANKWKTILVGGLGAGGQGIFALDITNPNQFREDNASNIVLWEFSDQDDNQLGFSYSKPVFARMHNGDWAVIFGNGYGCDYRDSYVCNYTKPALFIINALTGELIKKIETKYTSYNIDGGEVTNGLSSPSVADTDGDGIVDYIFAGDLLGHVWYFDVTSSNTNSWDVGLKTNAGEADYIFQAKHIIVNGHERVEKRQSISSAIRLARPEDGDENDLMLYFGTGKFFEGRDKTGDITTQSLYALKFRVGDSAQKIEKNKLQKRFVTGEIELERMGQPSRLYKMTSGGEHDQPEKDKGWYFELTSPQGIENVAVDDREERIVYTPIIRGNSIIFSTIMPSHNQCSAALTSSFFELNRFDGTPIEMSPFDVNNDGLIDEKDYVSGKPLSGFQEKGRTIRISGPYSTANRNGSANNGMESNKNYKLLNKGDGTMELVRERDNGNNSGRMSWREVD
ncbi:pilus assembly protein [Zooshikella ganghwensis]|uniref:PilY1 beta-propeller domain-containing protein n=1 Tax=Zooshikella ganghwensis TaxID=202772 RepID=A0A4P9VPS6_9GAMM|nr:PilC/PilY family type IV pilus protein [Zooshikella ganghwensis]RDH45508.1 hypothetical protein B9G39_19790 [Zooshikella ganghwensis]